MSSPSPSAFEHLAQKLAGDLHLDATMRTLYATDASVYREMPQAVVLPKSEEDIVYLIQFAREHGTALVPRTAGCGYNQGLFVTNLIWLSLRTDFSSRPKPLRRTER
jgi:FAD/FMN-containing dehydrogenase